MTFEKFKFWLKLKRINKLISVNVWREERKTLLPGKERTEHRICLTFRGDGNKIIEVMKNMKYNILIKYVYSASVDSMLKHILEYL